jgi:hypothetical protein
MKPTAAIQKEKTQILSFLVAKTLLRALFPPANNQPTNAEFSRIISQ